jgi:hypothetical protein
MKTTNHINRYLLMVIIVISIFTGLGQITDMESWDNPPWALFPGLQMGHPVGLPGQIFKQKTVLRLLLKYLQTIQEPGTIVEVDLTDPDHPKRSVSHVDEK